MTKLHQFTTSGRRLAVAAVLALMVTAMPANADPGVTQVDEFTYDDVNPCTGAPRTVESVYTTTIHEHPNLTLLRAEMRSVASDGTVERGVQIVTDHLRRGVVRIRFTTVNVDGEGNRFIGHVRLLIDESGFHEDRWYTCTGGPA